ncbi:uncharacterized protein LOC127902349 [Citrus sinensis]|uniref:uncharacterized protein LOC127902349 n=1 Tax=Citrus sinensis TaxID=2711 RepID=UPI00227804A6|nr:uncharacterized protein LOC127902349 [Citrus sinensis]
MAAHDLVLKGSRIRIGNGTCTLIKNNPWLPNLSNGLVSSELDDDLSVAIVKTLFVDDTWYWLANTNGVYSVKSAYRLLIGEVSDVDSNMWRQIWKLEVPAKKLFFICWFISKVGFFGIYSSFKDWLQALFRNCTNEQCWIAVMGKCDTANQIVNAAGNLLFQWQSAKSYVLFTQVSSDPGAGAIAWSPPRGAGLIVTLMLQCLLILGRVGLGSVIRDESGRFVAALCCNIRGNISPCDAEVLSICEALSWLKSMKLSKIIIETDCLQAYNALVDRKCPIRSFGSLVLHCKCIADSIGDIVFSFVRRSANSAAHFVARAGNSLPGREVWHSVPPSWLISVL